jgi:hypothetical protein
MQGNRPWVSRRLSEEAYLEAISQKLGKTVQPEGLPEALRTLFGEDAPEFATRKPQQAPELADLERSRQVVKLCEFLRGRKRRPGRFHPPNECEPVGALITGCQANENSVDVFFGGEAYGALSNALADIMDKKMAVTPKTDVSFRDLVTDIRAKLHKDGFSQNPCLECDDMTVDKPFICGISANGGYCEV